MHCNLFVNHAWRFPRPVLFGLFHTIENKFGINFKFSKYFKKISGFAFDQKFAFIYFIENALVTKILPKCSGRFLLAQA